MMKNKRWMHFLSSVAQKGRLCVVGGLTITLATSTVSATAASSENEVQNAQVVNQTKKITGKVVDETGEPLIGVSVLVKGTSVGAVTDMDGNFTVNAASNAVLTVSYIGYTTQNVKVGNRSNISVTLKTDNKLLDEVVVVGYGTVKKRDLTGAVSSVKSDVIKMTPVANPMESLQGRVAGLDITRSSGQAGSGVSLQLRGNRSFNASGSPLFIIDGMPGDYSTLNPNDIESIEVLKDASSTAVYGSSGSNGVIIITTKKGKAGKVSINFDAYMGINGWAKLIEMNDGYEWVRTRMLAQVNAGTVIDDIDGSIADEALARGQIIDWSDAILHTGHTQNYSLSVSGGTEKTQLYFSLNYSDEQGQYTNDEYKLYSSTIRVNQEITKWLSAGLHTQMSYTDQEKAYANVEKALMADPFGSIYEEDGSLKVFPIDGADRLNLLLNNDKSVYRNHPTKFRIYLQPYLRISPIKGLSLESRLSANWNYSKNNSFIGYGSYQFYNEAGKAAVGDEHNPAYAKYVSASIQNSDSFSYTWENVLTYNFQIADKHDFTLTAVSTWSDSKSNSATASNKGYTTNTYYWTNLGVSGTDNASVASSYSMGKSMGYVGRLNYSYLGRYLFSASVRHDGNSKLAKAVRWDTFPAFSAGWRISDESFMESTQDWLDNLKIRAGYGETGAAGISAYSSWSILQQGVIGLGSEQITSYYYPQKLSNPNLGWERSKNTNIGIDAAFLNNRIELTLDYYITNTDDVIWTQSLPVTNGGYNATTAFTMDSNIAKTKNVGLEATLTTRNIRTKDFSWESTFTFSKNKEKVTSLGEGASEYITHGSYTLHVGDPVKSYYGYKIAGIWQLDEEADAAAFGKRPGDLKIDVPNMKKVSDGVWEKSYPKELDEEGNVVKRTFDAENPYSSSDVDRVILGHNSPDWSLGFQNTFVWKNFDLSVYMYWRQGQMIYYDPMLWYKSSGGVFPSAFNYWTPTNPSNDFPALDASRDWTKDTGYSSKAYQDGSFFKVKNITLGYTMPTSLCRKIGIQGLRIYGTITNPYVKAKNRMLKSYDPEMNGSLDYPLTKQLVFGLNLSI